jgi:hypothetical protein
MSGPDPEDEWPYRDDGWCDWCGEPITTTPRKVGGKFFCGALCLAASRGAPEVVPLHRSDE